MITKRVYGLLLLCVIVSAVQAQSLPVKQVLIDGRAWDTVQKVRVGKARIELFRLIDGRLQAAGETISRDDGYFSFALNVADTTTVTPAFFQLRVSKTAYTTDTIIMTALPSKGKNGVLHAEVLLHKNPGPSPPPIVDCAAEKIVISGIARDSLSRVPLAGVSIAVYLGDSLIWRGLSLDEGRFQSDSIQLTVGQAMRVSAEAIKTGYRYQVCTCGLFYSSLATCRMFTRPLIEVTALMQKEQKSVRLIPKKDD